MLRIASGHVHLGPTLTKGEVDETPFWKENPVVPDKPINRLRVILMAKGLSNAHSKEGENADDPANMERILPSSSLWSWSHPCQEELLYCFSYWCFLRPSETASPTFVSNVDWKRLKPELLRLRLDNWSAPWAQWWHWQLSISARTHTITSTHAQRSRRQLKQKTWREGNCRAKEKWGDEDCCFSRQCGLYRSLFAIQLILLPLAELI